LFVTWFPNLGQWWANRDPDGTPFRVTYQGRVLPAVPDIDFENSYVTTRSKKTRKSMGSRPVPVPIMAELKKCVSGLDAEQEEIFNDNFSRYRWVKIR